MHNINQGCRGIVFVLLDINHKLFEISNINHKYITNTTIFLTFHRKYHKNITASKLAQSGLILTNSGQKSLEKWSKQPKSSPLVKNYCKLNFLNYKNVSEILISIIDSHFEDKFLFF